MSGIAKVLHDRGVSVTGSDLKESRYARALSEAGIPVFIGHDAENLGDPEVVVVSSAIPETNPELAAARARGIEVWPRAKMLARLAGEDATLAVAGTHGKTTTSSMLAYVLEGTGNDPTFLIGGELNDMGANARCGEGGYYVVEADESDGSFLFLEPHLSIVTNMEADHLDHYSSFQDIVDTFCDFVRRTPEDGCVVVCADDQDLVDLARRSARCRVVTYGMSAEADVRCDGLRPVGGGHEFEVRLPSAAPVAASVAVPGAHNVVNATGVLAAVWALGLDVSAAAAALAGFSGVRRRFERVGEVQGVVVVDDYAHHPTEVRATLQAARAAGHERIWVVFQPHRYSRTRLLAEDFGAAFGEADRVVLMDVYGAGEVPVPGVSGKTLLDAILLHDRRAQVAYFPHRTDIEGYVVPRVRPGDLVMTMGAGDVTTIGGELVRALDAVRS
ncbi:MAG: UDP-N-acetylmuramate--L-alanine ligase [Aeromicrobium sp.]|nr:UDP-N-acetylmuramate--L-alanine ligase [Aeromicrobium sp.]